MLECLHARWSFVSFRCLALLLGYGARSTSLSSEAHDTHEYEYVQDTIVQVLDWVLK